MLNQSRAANGLDVKVDACFSIRVAKCQSSNASIELSNVFDPKPLPFNSPMAPLLFICGIT